MKKIILFTASMLFAINLSAAETDSEAGKRLFSENCLSCHNADLDPPMAPPMFGVQKHYKRATADREAFINKLTAFAMDPSEEKAVMKMAVKHLGVMPDPGVGEADLRKIAAYIYDDSFSPPCNHWKAGMKMAKAQGDMEHFKKDQKRYNKMCAGQADSTIATPKPVSDGSLKRVMQQLGRDYSNLERAILWENFEAAAKAAHAIAYHDKPSMGQRMKIMGTLGSEMPEFKNADGKVHKLAVNIEEAARAKDMPLLIQHQSQMLSACMACHTTYRSRVIKALKQ